MFWGWTDSFVIKCLLQKLKDLSLIPKAYTKSQVWWYTIGNPQLEKGRSLGSVTDSLTFLVSSRPKKGGGGREKRKGEEREEKRGKQGNTC